MGFTSSSRVKREECKRTKHDSIFSQWEILIGPSDWENHSLGTDGIEKYRIHNIPLSCSCPGLYELGVAAVHTDIGRNIRKLDSSCIVAVYLGQADNVRTRLQHYGRAGSHLDNVKKLFVDCDDYSSKGPGLFRDIFSRGFPIVFRWAPMENKKLAEKTEARLLSFFDYAWNKGGNGVRRPNDVYLKLDTIVSSNISSLSFAKKIQKWLNEKLLRERKEGIKIETRFSLLNKAKFRPGLIPVKREPDNTDHPVCGLFLGDGSLCTRMPVKGRKRCGEHKGKRNMNFSRRSLTQGKLLVSTTPLENDSHLKFNIHEGKSCQLQGQTLSPSHNPKVDLLLGELNTVCGVVLNDLSICRDSPIKGRKRCEKHKGMRITKSLSEPATEGSLRVCGVGLRTGEVCMEVPVLGRKRCRIHKGRRATFSKEI